MNRNNGHTLENRTVEFTGSVGWQGRRNYLWAKFFLWQGFTLDLAVR